MAENSTEEQVIDTEAQENVEAVAEEKTETPEVGETDSEKEAAEKASKESKKSKKKPKHDKRDDEIADLKDRLTRNLAEFDNFRKRTDKEKSQMFDMGAKSMIEKLLPVVDNFERGLASLSDEAKAEPFAQGIEKIYQQLVKTLEDAGVEPIKALGEEFNAEFHNAVMHVEDDNYGENIICEEFQKGYMFHGSVVRFSMVKVAN